MAAGGRAGGAGCWPSLRALSVVGVPPSTTPTEDVAPDIRTLWLEACLHDPNSDGAERPDFKPWTSLSSKQKHELLHDRARKAFGYVTAYTEETMDELGRCGWSVEHVVLRSHILGKEVGDGENDPNGCRGRPRRELASVEQPVVSVAAGAGTHRQTVCPT